MGTVADEPLWVLRAQSGDRDAIEWLIGAIQPSLVRYLSSLVGASDADDVAQDVLVQVYRKLAWLEDPRLFRPWVFRIASRAGFRHLKKRRRWPAITADEASAADVPAPLDAPSDGRLRELLASDALSPASRAVLVLHFQEELSLPDVAAILELPLGTVKSRLAYGLSRLRQHLGLGRST